MSIAPRYRGVLIGMATSVLLGSSLWLGCGHGGRSDSGGSGDTGTTGVPVLDKECNAAKAPTTKDTLNACLKGLHFVEEELQGDQQRLMVFDTKPGPSCPGTSEKIQNCRLGPLARIQPEVHSNQGDERLLEQQGKIIALLTLDKSAKEDYPKLALFRGHSTYWWVKKGTGGASDTSVYVSDSVKSDGTLYSVGKELKIEALRSPRDSSFKHALARWIWVPDDETTKGTCSSSSSCK